MFSRIHIIGGPGSGKTYLARRLSELYGIPCYDLDDIFWDKSSDTYGQRNAPRVRDQLLRNILKEPEWVLEGVYYAWLEEAFLHAEMIVVLRPSVLTRDLRICRRFAERKLGLVKSKRETFSDFIALLKYNHMYDAVNLVNFLTVVEPYQEKLLRCTCADEALNRIAKAVRERCDSGEKELG